MPQPSDHGGFGPPLDRDTLRPGYGAAADRGGVVGHGTGQSMGEGLVTFMEAEERYHRTVEIFNIVRLGLIPASGVGVLASGVALGGSFGIEFGPNALDGRRRCPHAPGEDLAALLFLHDPVV